MKHVTIIEQAELERQQRYIGQIGQCLDAYRSETGFSRRYWIHTYGCQLNENDGEKIAGLLAEMGYIESGDLREADLIILNTCSVREHADDRLFGNLGRLKNLRLEKPDLVIAVCGCMMKQPEHVTRISRSFAFVDLIFGPQDIYRLPELLYHRLTEGKKQYLVGDEDTLVEGLPVHRARRFRALCSIMFGCNNFCTYCIVPYTRGRERSRQPGDILRELRQLAASGYREVMLLGQNVNSYGQDIGDSDAAIRDFADLLQAAAHEPFYRIRFMTSHPKDISEKLLQVMAAHPVIEPHLHLPLQSGSNRVLERMNRQYSREQYLAIVRRARQLIPGLAISTDIIVGFPGETEEDFAATLDVLEQVRFASAFTFLYSRRTGTPAAEMADPVDPAVMHERFTRLTALQDAHSLDVNRQNLGQSVEILVEGASAKQEQVFSGRTGQNQLVNFTVADPALLPAEARRPDGGIDGNRLEGGLARVRILEAKTFSLFGVLEAYRP
ncbi:MAG: tRNA (N6-isopentenyl adenosine(37)-C2)-methylthiotransferase MiaB [Clostridiaceae bacterium]|nr:tRNA (N6-isopentenyl adenosine(37)-C2)-methylthiotransferase MiaB [Clostridiaceae bacterium]